MTQDNEIAAFLRPHALTERVKAATTPPLRACGLGAAWWLLATGACMISVASIREVAIKHRVGRLSIDPVTFRDQSLAVGAMPLTINDAHAIETARVPGIHADPFNRLIIAQARIAGLMAVFSDGRWSQCSIARQPP